MRKFGGTAFLQKVCRNEKRKFEAKFAFDSFTCWWPPGQVDSKAYYFILSMNNNQFHSYVYSIYSNELEIKDTTECSTSESYLDMSMNLDANDKLMTQLYDERNDFNFSINFPDLCSNISSSFEYGIYILQLIRYSRACSAYDHFLILDSLSTNKLMSQGFLKSRLQAAFRNFYGRYNDLVCQYSLPLGQMLSIAFHTNC
jgi:hypothetical protein